jgi:pimeloyl-ACP methyl ester carboxylesterase
MLAKHGFGVLAIDLRGHGESEGAANALGWQRDKDIAAAIQFLSGEGIEHIGALGTSLGGESLLGECYRFPEIEAIVSDGATHSSIADYLVLPSRENLFRSWTTRVMYASAQLFTGQTPPETTMQASITAASATRFLFIAAENTEEEVEYNTVFAKAAEGRSELWTVPGAGHTQAFGIYTEEYESRVTEFLKSALLSQD